jgi:hypothetical protein
MSEALNICFSLKEGFLFSDSDKLRVRACVSDGCYLPFSDGLISTGTLESTLMTTATIAVF